MTEIRTVHKLAAEFVGTFVLVFFGCGSAVYAAVQLNPDKIPVGIGYLGVAIAFGLSVLTMAFAVGHISGGHFNPAVSVGAAVAGRMPWKDVPGYVIAQVLGATVSGAVLFAIASGKEGFDAVKSGFASNGYGDRSPDGYGLLAALLVEIVLTAIFLVVILGATDARVSQGFAPIAIGLALTAIHLVSIPITNTSVNPARSLGVAWFAGGSAMAQVWLFIVAPVIGATIGGLLYPAISASRVLLETGTGSQTPDQVAVDESKRHRDA